MLCLWATLIPSSLRHRDLDSFTPYDYAFITDSGSEHSTLHDSGIDQLSLYGAINDYKITTIWNFEGAEKIWKNVQVWVSKLSG